MKVTKSYNDYNVITVRYLFKLFSRSIMDVFKYLEDVAYIYWVKI